MSYAVGDLVEVVRPGMGHEFDIGEIVRVRTSCRGATLTCEHLDKHDWWYMNDTLVRKALTLTDIKQYDILEYKDDFLIVQNIYSSMNCITVSSILGKEFTDGINDFREEHVKDIKQVVCNLKDIFSNINI